MAFTKIVGAGIHTLSNVHTHNINSSGIITATNFVGIFSGTNGDFSGNVTIDGNLTVNGNTTTLDTTLQEVDQLFVSANNTNYAGIITQTGTGNILGLFDGSSRVFNVADGGAISTKSLTVSGDIDIIDGDPRIKLTDSNASNAYAFIDGQAGKLKLFADLGNNVSNSEIIFGVDGSTPKMVIKDTGNVGIGSEIPTDKLDIIATGGDSDEVTKFKVKIAGQLELTRNHASAPYIKTFMSSGNPAIHLGDSSGDRTVIHGHGDSYFNGGNVNIGMTGDSTPLAVKGISGALSVNSRATLSLITGATDGASETGTGILFFNHSGAGQFFGGSIQVLKENSGNGNTASLMRFATRKNGDPVTERMRITSGGTLGINLESPDTSFRLDCSGAAQFTTSTSNQQNDFNTGQLTVRNNQSGQGAFIDFRADSSNGTQGVIAKIGGFNVHSGSGYDGIITFSTRQNSNNTMVERMRITNAGSVNIGGDYTQTTYKSSIEATDGNVLRLVNDDDGTDGPELLLFHDSASPANEDNVGAIHFSGNDNVGNISSYVLVEGYSSNVDNNSESGYLRVRTRHNGSVSEKVRITSNGQVIVGHESTYGGAKLSVVGDSTVALVDNNENFSRTNDAFALIHNKNTGNVESGLTILSSGSAGAVYNMYVKKTGSYAGDLIFRSRTGVSSSAERLRIKSDGVVIIGPGAVDSTKASTSGLDISSGIYSIIMGGETNVGTGDGRRNAQQKESRLGMPHYTNAEEPFGLVYGVTLSGENRLNLGGGSSIVNAATSIKFYTAGNTTTTAGTERLSIDSNGVVTISNSNPPSTGAMTFITDEGSATTLGSAATLRVANNGNSASYSVFEAQSNSGSIRLANDGKFDVSGALRIISSVAKISMIDTDGGDYYQLRNTDGVFTIRNSTDGQDALKIDGDGNVTTVKNIRVNISTAVDGILGEAYSGYFGLKHADQTINSEYMILSNNNHTYISSTSGHSIYLRPSANDSAHETIFSADNTTFKTNIVLDNHQLRRNQHHKGHMEGGYNNIAASNYKTSPIYTIGSAYNPDEEGLSNMYGIGYSHRNASFIESNCTSGWGLYVAADGDARIFLNGSDGRIFANSSYNRVLHQRGHLEGGHDNIGSTAAKTSPIYTIGSSYRPNEESLNNMYGVGYSNGDHASFLPAGGWGMYIASDGDARIYLDAENGIMKFNGGKGAVHFTNGSWSGEISTGKIQTHANNMYLQSAGGFWQFRKTDGVAAATIAYNGTYSGSDLKFKKDVVTISNAVDTIKKLTGRSFTWKEDDTKSFGVIAQEVETVLPELVSVTEEPEGSEVEPSKMVNYSAFAGHFIEAIKELSAKLETLEQENTTLKARVTTLEGS